jgi:hypothetical protein
MLQFAVVAEAQPQLLQLLGAAAVAVEELQLVVGLQQLALA